MTLNTVDGDDDNEHADINDDDDNDDDVEEDEEKDLAEEGGEGKAIRCRSMMWDRDANSYES